MRLCVIWEFYVNLHFLCRMKYPLMSVEINA